MSDSESGDNEQDAHRLLEDVILLNGAVDKALYQAFRYYSTGYDHKREDAIEEIENLRECLDETLERYEDTYSSPEPPD